MGRDRGEGSEGSSFSLARNSSFSFLLVVVMLSPEEVNNLNEILAFHGRIPYGPYVGQGVFHLRKARDLVLPHKTGTRIIALPSGIDLVIPVYEMISQLRPQDGDRWVIAKWTCQDEQSWNKQHEGKVEWPKHGYLYCFLPLEPSRDPTEEQIRAFVDHIEYQKSLTPQEHLAKVIEQGEKPFEDYSQKVEDLMEEHFVNHVPGKRGGIVSYPDTNPNLGKA